MPIRRVFVDWSRPALPLAAGYLWERYGAAGELNLERVIVAVPGGRAGRRLLQALVAVADEHAAVLVPPKIVTPSELPELLYEKKLPFAGELVQQLAWIRAIRAQRPAQLERLIKRLPTAGDLAGWLALAQTLNSVHRELAADGLDFARVLAEAPAIEGFLETDRWKVLAALQKRYLQTLDEQQLWDVQTARLFAVEHRLCATDRDIVLVAMVDIDRTVRAMLDQVAERVTALILAPTVWPSGSTRTVACWCSRGASSNCRSSAGRSRWLPAPPSRPTRRSGQSPPGMAGLPPMRSRSACRTSACSRISKNDWPKPASPPATGRARPWRGADHARCWPPSPIIWNWPTTAHWPRWCGIPICTIGS